jgi:uncharacterized damage-inducible protein DinB
MEMNGRIEPVHEGDERATLAAFLDFQRDTLVWKCSGLTADQLRRREVPPSSISLLGIVRHMVEVERSWFRHVLAGDQGGGYWTSRKPFEDGDDDAEWDVAEADPDEAFAVWRAECANSREALAGAASLGVTGAHVHPNGEKEVFSLRWILTHMIEEYARHNGHADLVRERIDGKTGE